MPLYEASFLGEPQPIKPVKKSRSKKAAPDVPVPVETPAAIEPKPKAVRKRKAPEPKEEIAAPIQPLADPAPYGLNKRGKPYKRPQKPLQEATPSATSEESESPAPKKGKGKAKEEPTEEEAPKKKRAKKAPAPENKKVIIDGVTVEEPPSWFKSYLHDEAKRRNADKPKAERAKSAVVKNEADIKAHEKWSDGLVRDRVNNEVNSHMGRLYSQIYGRRF